MTHCSATPHSNTLAPARIERLKPVDGVRAITHLSLIALHASMISTSHLPSDGSLWKSVKSNYIFTAMQAGGVQVDIMFLLSGFLLVESILRKAESENIILSTAKRYLRMAPCIALIAIIALYMGEYKCFL